MKTYLSVIIVGIYLLSACSAGYEKVPTDAIDQTELAKAKALALKLISACETGDYPTLSTDEATLTVIDGLTAQRQQEACDYLKKQYGTFERLSIGEVLQTAETADFRIYRFKGSFKETEDLAEVRVTLDKQGKMSGIWIMPWADGL